MSLSFLSVATAFALTGSALAAPLRVCADPNNLPFSNTQQQGFENKIAEVVAASMNTTVEYTWWPQRKSFAKKSLDAGACEVILGVTASMPDVLTTKPYYRSTYVFVTRRDRDLQIASLLDPRLHDLRIGVHVVGDDLAPPSFALAREGMTQNVIGFSLLGPAGEANPARKLVDAVAAGSIDVAIVWGPFAGYFERFEPQPLQITPVQPAAFMGVPFVYGIAAAVKTGNEQLKARLDSVLQADANEIDRILDEYGVPQAGKPE